MNPSAAVDQVLYQLRCYPDKNRVRNDAITMISSFTSLRPTVTPAPTGPQPLFNMTGTIPVIFKASKYNIPISIWIPEAYPYRTPLVYVTPTPDMAVTRGHPHVDAGGVVYLPYLNTWNPATHSLLPLVQAMCLVFGKQSPLYAIQRPPAAGPSATAMRSQPQPGYGYGPGPGPQAQPHPQPGYGAPNPAGPYPPARPSQPSHPYSPYSQPQAQPSAVEYPGQTPKPLYAPNPMDAKREELRRRCREQIRERASEDLGVKIARLEAEKRAKEDMAGNVQAQEEQLKKEAEELTEKLKEVEEFLAANSGEVDIDKTTDPKDMHRLQLIQCVSLDMAIEDTLYHFDRALLKGVLGLDEYLKLYRQYSNDQFYQRALVKRIREVIIGQPGR